MAGWLGLNWAASGGWSHSPLDMAELASLSTRAISDHGGGILVSGIESSSTANAFTYLTQGFQATSALQITHVLNWVLT
jgi:hypothetical protein